MMMVSIKYNTITDLREPEFIFLPARPDFFTHTALFICIYMNMYLFRYLGYLCRSDAVKSRSWKMENAKHVGLMMLDVDVLTGYTISHHWQYTEVMLV